MDIESLWTLYGCIPPRGPRGSPKCLEWERATSKFEREAKRQGLEIVEAYKICRDKSVSEGTSLST
jgi:hypothetical protein